MFRCGPPIRWPAGRDGRRRQQAGGGQAGVSRQRDVRELRSQPAWRLSGSRDRKSNGGSGLGVEQHGGSGAQESA